MRSTLTDAVRGKFAFLFEKRVCGRCNRFSGGVDYDACVAHLAEKHAETQGQSDKRIAKVLGDHSPVVYRLDDTSAHLVNYLARVRPGPRM